MEHIKRLVRVDQKPIGRTPRSNLATYTGLFDHVRKLFAATKAAQARHYDAGRFSFNVAKGRCETCEGEGFVMVELLFLPSVYAPCPTCHGARYNAKTLEITYRGKNIAEVLGMTVDAACEFFEDEASLERSLGVLREVGLGYLRLGQPATELSGGEAQRIKLATELQRVQRGNTLYVLDEPTTGLHPSDVEKLMAQLDGLVDAGNTVIVVEHDMRVVAGSDWVIDIGPGAGDEGGHIVAEGSPADSRTRGAEPDRAISGALPGLNDVPGIRLSHANACIRRDRRTRMARVFITGSADGLGQMAAQLLVDDGHQVVLHARNDARARDAMRAVPGAERALVGDLSSIAETKALAAQANALGTFDAIIHNAAVGYRERARIETVDGLPHVFAINTLAPYILTALIQASESTHVSRLGYAPQRGRHAARSRVEATWMGWLAGLRGFEAAGCRSGFCHRSPVARCAVECRRPRVGAD